MKLIFMCLTLAVSFIASAQSVPTLAQIPLSLADDQSAELGNIIHFELVTLDTELLLEDLKQYQGLEAIRLNDDSIAVSMAARPQFTGLIEDKYLLSSWVIDLDETATKAFVDGFNATQSKSVSLEAIPAYVSEFITNPTYEHAFHIASVVAKQRSGDCTEYAVLTTALARALQLHARVALGTVITTNQGEVSAFGHAWTEVWYRGKWQIIDAALYGAIGSTFYYFPNATLENEGPGFSLSLLAAGKRFPNRIYALRSVKTNTQTVQK